MNRRPFVRAALMALALSCAALTSPAQNVSRGVGSLRLMTYNVFQGTNYAPLLSATDLPTFIAGVGGVLAEVRASQPRSRMQALARQIAAAAPTVVSLQEVNRWTSGSLNPVTLQCGTMSTEFDLLDDLIAELAALGVPYALAAQVTQFAIPALPARLPTGQFLCVGVLDRNALLVRADVDSSRLQWRNAQVGVFEHALPVPTPLGTLFLPNGWMSIDVTFLNRSLRMFGAHLAIDPQLRRAQGVELRAIAGASTLPVAIAMDSNAQAAPAPLDATYADFIGDGYVDGWSLAEPGLAGLSCCQLSLDGALSQLFQRVDLVLTRGAALQAQNGALFGDTAASKTAGGLWPSDHAGVAVQYSLEPAR